MIYPGVISMDLKKIIKLEEDGVSYSVDVERLNRLAERKGIAFASDLKRTDAQMVAFVGAGRIPGLEQGYYLDRQGAKWALLVGLEADRIQRCVNDVCPAHMRYLAVAGTNIKEISFNLGSYLQELWLIDNPKLHTIYGLKGLSDVQKLKLHLNLRDTELNLSEMQGLEELDLRGTELGGIRLDDPLKYLKKCDLRGAKIDDLGFLSKCPALSNGLESDLTAVDSRDEPEETVLHASSRDRKQGGCSNAGTTKRDETLQKDLMTALVEIQRDRKMQKAEEDDRNDRLISALRLLRYRVEGQAHIGTGGTGVRAGALDLLVYSDDGLPWANVEALNLSDVTETALAYWNEHLDKVLDNYNTSGIPTIYLMSYVDSDPDRFGELFEKYTEHMKTYKPRIAKVRGETMEEIFPADHRFNLLRVTRCAYTLAGANVMVYHYFVGFTQERLLEESTAAWEKAVLNAIQKNPNVKAEEIAWEGQFTPSAIKKTMEKLERKKKIAKNKDKSKGKWIIL